MATVSSARLPGLATRTSDVRDSGPRSGMVRVTHWVNALSFFGLLVSGFAILLAHPRFYWGEAAGLGSPSLISLPLPFMKGGPSGWGRNLHFLSAWVCVLNGLIYALSGMLTRHFHKNLLPAKADLAWGSISRAVASHLRFERPGPGYNILQKLTYAGVVFVLFPLMIWTGFAMAPAIVSAFPFFVTVLGGQQSARTIHFLASDLLILFLIVHVAMVYLAGFKNRVGAMIPDYSGGEEAFSRRKLVTAGLATAAGASGLAVAARLADRYGLIPPDHGGLYGAGQTLTYASQRPLMSHDFLAREFNRSDISKICPVNGGPPESETYHRLLAGDFADWRLSIEGMVARPLAFSLAGLKRLPSRSQITHQACEEGWSFIAEWVGVPLSYVLNLAGVLPQAKYVVFFTLGEKNYPLGKKWGSLDMLDAWHPQTLLAYAMNGQELPAPHGAPVRLRVARQLGFKSLKYLSRIILTDTVKNIGEGLGSSSPEHGFSWYGGI